ncbi:hypothetical protein [Paracoccus actinidiae]|uniref:hypothetical protein n=1 Tax=Paracoccus actinidiae TaxID=3064531 RepID=UPI0027D2515D|nr:hypothetical protein [Paracoccus sp. M09]
MAWHKFLGVLVMACGIWLERQGVQKPAASMPRWQEAASKLVHGGLLAAIVAKPVGHLDDHRRRSCPDHLTAAVTKANMAAARHVSR